MTRYRTIVAFLRRMYDPCIACRRPSRRGGFLLCPRCFRRYRP